MGSTPTPATSRKLALTVGLVVVTAALVGFAAFAQFTGSASAEQQTQTGTVSLAPIDVSGPNNRLSVGASDLAAGDTIERVANVRNGGSIELASITLTTTATTSSLLDTNTADGLQMQIERCSVPWTEAGGPPYTYTCAGATSLVAASRPVVGADLALANLDLAAGADNHLRVTLSLPASAPNALQAQSSVLQYAFTAVQRAGQSR